MHAGQSTTAAHAGRIRAGSGDARPRARRGLAAARLLVALVPIVGAAAVGAAELEIRWRAAVGGPAPGGFVLERRAPGEAEFGELVRLPASSRSHLDSGLEAGLRYCYRVRAVGGVSRVGGGGPAPTAPSEETCGVAGPPGAAVAAPPPVVDVPGPTSAEDPRHRPDRTRAPGGWIQQVEPGGAP